MTSAWWTRRLLAGIGSMLRGRPERTPTGESTETWFWSRLLTGSGAVTSRSISSSRIRHGVSRETSAPSHRDGRRKGTVHSHPLLRCSYSLCFRERIRAHARCPCFTWNIAIASPGRHRDLSGPQPPQCTSSPPPYGEMRKLVAVHGSAPAQRGRSDPTPIGGSTETWLCSRLPTSTTARRKRATDGRVLTLAVASRDPEGRDPRGQLAVVAVSLETARSCGAVTSPVDQLLSDPAPRFT